MRDAVRKGASDFPTASLILTYTLSKALGISPLEIMQMPASLVVDLLYVHKNIEEFKADTMKKEMDKVKR